MSFRSSYDYQIRSSDGTAGYVGRCQGKYVFTPLTYPEFAAAMLMARDLNKRTSNEHEVYPVKKRRKVNGRYGPMRRSAIAPVKGDAYGPPKAEDEQPPVIEQKQDSAKDEGVPEFDPVSAEEKARRARLEELSRLMPEPEVEVEECY